MCSNVQGLASAELRSIPTHASFQLSSCQPAVVLLVPFSLPLHQKELFERVRARSRLFHPVTAIVCISTSITPLGRASIKATSIGRTMMALRDLSRSCSQNLEHLSVFDVSNETLPPRVYFRYHKKTRCVCVDCCVTAASCCAAAAEYKIQPSSLVRWTGYQARIAQA